ncbi:V-type ATP synthase subunit I [Kiritimatiella glycovorans]|nr:hypothetical protein [Kiritimatiella glycovorans]
MKKLILLCLEREVQPTLEEVGRFGQVHVEHLRRPEGEDLEGERARLERTKRALALLPEPEEQADPECSGEEIIASLEDLDGRRHRTREMLEKLRGERKRIAPFGEFDPLQVRELANRDIHIRLYKTAPKQPVPEPDDAVVRVFRRAKGEAFFAVISRSLPKIEAEPIDLPDMSLSEMDEWIRRAERELQEIAQSLKRCACYRHVLEDRLHLLETRVHFHEVERGMEQAEPVAVLKGFCPAEREEELRGLAARRGWGVILTDPEPEDRVPTLIRNPRWVRPIKAIFDMIGITPGYREVDVSMFFLIFLSIFFAILVGDAGYGALFLGMTLAVRAKWPHAPGHLFHLLILMSSCTIVWGVLTGTYFGTGLVPGPLERLQIGWLTGEGADAHLMLLCFVIGAVHLSLAHGWNAIRLMNSVRALSQIGWIGVTWSMFFAVRYMVLNEPFPPAAGWTLLGSAVLVLLFMNPPREIKKNGFGYVTFPLDLINNFVDLVSYVRLFAVGAATFAVAHSFNQMALETGYDGVVSGIVATLIIFLGHTMNILLAAMAVMVHGVRLNALEFSSHVGMEWSGTEYRPFRYEADSAGNT